MEERHEEEEGDEREGGVEGGGGVSERLTINGPAIVVLDISNYILSAQGHKQSRYLESS